MFGKPRPGRYRLHGLDSPEAGAVLAEQGLTRADLERALAELERTEGTRIRSIVGINHDGVFGSTRQGWHPDLGDQLGQRPPGDREIIHPQSLTSGDESMCFAGQEFSGSAKIADTPPREFRGHTQRAARPVP
jgi:hypothetical protein